MCIIYFADRTGLWFKEQKQFNPWVFAFLSFASLSVGLATVRRGDKDLGFLNRDQSDEWKGWMQSMSCMTLCSWHLTFLFSCNPYLSLPWSVEDIWDLQPDSSSRCRISFHDWLWSHNLLFEESRLWFSSHCSSQ